MYKETLESLLKAEKMDEHTVLYRYTNAHHLKKDEAGNSSEKPKDIFEGRDDDIDRPVG